MFAAAVLVSAVAMAGTAHAAGGEKAAVAPTIEYYEVPPVVVPVITDKGLTQQVALAISLELEPGEKDKIAAYGPRLVDAYLSDLFGAMGSGQVMMKGNLVDLEAIKLRLAAVTGKVLGDKRENVKAVLLQAVQQNRTL